MSSFPVQREAEGVSSVAGSQAQAEGLARSQSVPQSHPQQAGGHTLGFFRTGATWRPLPAIYQPPQPPKAPPPIPLPFQRSVLGPRAQACPWHGSRLPSLTSGSSAMRKVAIQRGGTRSPNNRKNKQLEPTLASQQTSQSLFLRVTNIFTLSKTTVFTPTRPFPHSVSGSHNQSHPSRGSIFLHSIILQANSQKTRCFAHVKVHNSPLHPVTFFKYT